MLDQLNQLKIETLQKISEAENLEALNLARQAALGKKGGLTKVLKELGKLSNEEKATVGKAANEIKAALTGAIASREEDIINQGSSIDYEMDLTLPGIAPVMGGLHPITQMCYDLNDAFRSLNFDVYD